MAQQALPIPYYLSVLSSNITKFPPFSTLLTPHPDAKVVSNKASAGHDLWGELIFDTHFVISHLILEDGGARPIMRL